MDLHNESDAIWLIGLPSELAITENTVEPQWSAAHMAQKLVAL